jgi:chemotaxis protein MotB
MEEEVKTSARERRKKKKSDDAPGWLMTYGDMMTLLLTFFVLLISFSSIQQSKFEMAIGSLKEALGVLTGGRSTFVDSRLPLLEISNPPSMNFMASFQKLMEFIDREEYRKGMVEVEVSDQGLLFRISNKLLFEIGKADLILSTKEFLLQLSNVLQKIEGNIRVEGHTCDLPIHTPEFPSNWELSAKRAINVIKFFSRQGVSPDRLSAIGYGEYRPLAENDSEENRKKNRRVEIFIEFREVGLDPSIMSVIHRMTEKINHM